MGGSNSIRNRKRKFHGNRYTVNKKVDSDMNVTVTTSAKKLDRCLIDDDQMKEELEIIPGHYIRKQYYSLNENCIDNLKRQSLFETKQARKENRASKKKKYCT
ncbi:hypothetical protein NPIL_337971 [Nephila pilipes]|uniref:Uncharacterized protein n=1 Tax=Nephila pilipes TaxID=299642 RepID=A0A8X6Q1K5_NEPPI|nr:hypothetical protein NPIL_337971 [Nephila pilipes]